MAAETLNGPAAPGIYLVTDVRLYREGLVGCLERQTGLRLLGAGSCAEAVNAIGALRPDVMLLDAGATDSLALTRQARLMLPMVRVVAFGITEIEADVLACAEAGACSYVAKDASLDDLLAAVQSAISGELLCSPRIAASLFSRLGSLSSARERPAAEAPLTAREQEIATLVASGMPNKEVARRLSLGPATIKNHVHNILQKLNLQRRAEIAAVLGQRIAASAGAADGPRKQRIRYDHDGGRHEHASQSEQPDAERWFYGANSSAMEPTGRRRPG